MLKLRTNKTMSNALVYRNAEKDRLLAHNRDVSPEPLQVEST